MAGCSKPPKQDVNGDLPKDVVQKFLSAVSEDDIELARSYWDDIPHEVNGGGRGEFSEEFNWWKSFSEVQILGTYEGMNIEYDPNYYHYKGMDSKDDITYYHVVTSCYKDGERVAGPHLGLYLHKK